MNCPGILRDILQHKEKIATENTEKFGEKEKYRDNRMNRDDEKSFLSLCILLSLLILLLFSVFSVAGFLY